MTQLIMTSQLLMCSSVIPHTVARSEFIFLKSYSLHTTATGLQLYHPSLCHVTLLGIGVQYEPSLDAGFWGNFSLPKILPNSPFNYLVHTVCTLFTLHTF